MNSFFSTSRQRMEVSEVLLPPQKNKQTNNKPQIFLYHCLLSIIQAVFQPQTAISLNVHVCSSLCPKSNLSVGTASSNSKIHSAATVSPF